MPGSQVLAAYTNEAHIQIHTFAVHDHLNDNIVLYRTDQSNYAGSYFTQCHLQRVRVEAGWKINVHLNCCFQIIVVVRSVVLFIVRSVFKFTEPQ